MTNALLFGCLLAAAAWYELRPILFEKRRKEAAVVIGLFVLIAALAIPDLLEAAHWNPMRLFELLFGPASKLLFGYLEG